GSRVPLVPEVPKIHGRDPTKPGNLENLALEPWAPRERREPVPFSGPPVPLSRGLAPSRWPGRPHPHRLRNTNRPGGVSMRHVTVGGAAAGTLLIALTIAPLLGAASASKIPITTSSEEARQLYLKGRDLAEKLRATDARKFYEQAAQKDPGFAMAYVGLANTSGTTKQFIEATIKAVSLAGRASEGERHIVLALEAGMKNDPSGVLQHY